MRVLKGFLLVAVILFAATAWSQSKPKEPHIGYLYPSGGQRGTVFRLLVGGQSLRGVDRVHVSGEGVRAKVIQHYKPLRNLKKEQRLELQNRLHSVREKRIAELPKRIRMSMRPGKRPANRGARRGGKATIDDATPAEPVTLPEHPYLDNLEEKSLRELHNITNEFFNRKRKQPNAQIAESVRIELSIDSDALPGDRELRLETPRGLTNPMCLQVGVLPETCEGEPNDPTPTLALLSAPTLDLPILVNGQIKPGDVDRFRFRARRGKRLVIQVQARHLIPYLADAVPGWFQATLSLYGPKGNEVAFTDDYRFDPDPVLFWEVREDGIYELEVRDSIYRGREDFIYRIAVGEQPFITQIFPLGGRAGEKTAAAIFGWNLPKDRLKLATEAGAPGIRETVLWEGDALSNPVRYAVGTLPESDERDPNNAVGDAQRVDLSCLINGRIEQPGDTDVFAFDGSAGDEVVAEVHARRLQSPLDSLLRLTGVSGCVVAWNDDWEDKASGLNTHHADSYLRARLPASGEYRIHLSDAQNRGSDAHAYRLRISQPKPDFALRMTPSSLNMRAGGTVPVWVHALRKDGFQGDIQLTLQDAPKGFQIHGGRVPAGCDRIRITLTAPGVAPERPTLLNLTGSATIGDRTISRLVVPAEDRMQAFLYRHLVPSQNLMVSVTGGKRNVRPIVPVGRGAVRVPEGGTVQVRLKVPRFIKTQGIELQLNEPPNGVTLQDVTLVPVGVAFALKTDGEVAKAGFADNLIVEAFGERVVRRKGKDGEKQKRRVSLGVLPAIPFEIVPR